MKGCPWNTYLGKHRKLYIPHGSDESSHFLSPYWWFVILYIPHGSDESIFQWLKLLLLFSFISHMVQMKGKKWKLLIFIQLALYPTWFRWKVKSHLNSFLQFLLYIPHGSDESFSVLSDFKTLTTFISHMVQMKDLILPCLKHSCITLYPTWFRWKNSLRRRYGRLCYILYIPHGSDERRQATPFRPNHRSLYPTWFRWKL